MDALSHPPFSPPYGTQRLRGPRAPAGCPASALWDNPTGCSPRCRSTSTNHSLRRIRLRLGLGGRLPAPQAGLLPQMARRGAVSRRSQQRILGRDAASRRTLIAQVLEQVRDSGASSSSVSPTAAGWLAEAGLEPSRACSSIGKFGLPGFRRLPRPPRPAQAQEYPRQERRKVADAGVTFRAPGRGHRRRLGVLPRLLLPHLRRTPLRRPISRGRSSRISTAPGPSLCADDRRTRPAGGGQPLPAGCRAPTAATGARRNSSPPALRGLLLPGHRLRDPAGPRPFRGRRPGRAQAPAGWSRCAPAPPTGSPIRASGIRCDVSAQERDGVDGYLDGFTEHLPFRRQANDQRTPQAAGWSFSSRIGRLTSAASRQHHVGVPHPVVVAGFHQRDAAQPGAKEGADLV